MGGVVGERKIVEMDLGQIRGGKHLVIEKMIELEDDLHPSLLSFLFLNLYFFLVPCFFLCSVFFFY